MPEPKLWNAKVACHKCGRVLIPLSYPLPSDLDPRGNARPDLKCPGCGQHHRWRGSAWVPTDTE